MWAGYRGQRDSCRPAVATSRSVQGFVQPHQPLLKPVDRRLRPVDEVELGQDVGYVCLDGLFTDRESLAISLLERPRANALSTSRSRFDSASAWSGPPCAPR